jgi:ribosomal protein L20
MIKLTDSQDKNSELQKNWVTLNESYKELEVKYQKLVEELKMARV